MADLRREPRSPAAGHRGEAGQPFYGFQSPDLEASEPMGLSLGDLAARYLEELRTVQPEGPYRLGGWSLGGIIAFEMARQLEAADEGVSLLAVVDARLLEGPAVQEIDEPSLLASFARSLSLPEQQSIRLLEKLRQLPPQQRLDGLLRFVQDTGLVLPDTGREELRRLLKLFSSHLSALARWQPAPYGGRLTFFLPAEEIGGQDHPTRGWKDLARGGVEVVQVPGDHFSIMRAPHVAVLAKRLGRRLKDSG